MATIFVGTSGDDLRDHRERALTAIRELDEAERRVVLHSNEDSAARLDPYAYGEERAGCCDLYIGLFGHLTGPRRDDKTWLARVEYEAARANGRPCLLLFAEDELEVPARLLVAESAFLAPQADFRRFLVEEAQIGRYPAGSFRTPDSTAAAIYRHVPGLLDRLSDGAALQSEELRAALMPQPAASRSETQGFKTIGGRHLLDAVRDHIDSVFGRRVEVRITDGFKDAGCDIHVSFINGACFGLQIKSWGDVEKDGFTPDLKRQVAETLRHKFKTLFVLVGADLTDNTHWNKVRNLENEPGIGQTDGYVGLIPPERFWPLVASKTVQTAPPAPRLPLPPAPWFAHPYRLQEHFTGRVAERQRLTGWLRSPDARPVMMLDAIGGMGKSALTWTWMLGDVLGLPVPGMVAAGDGAARLAEEDRPEAVLWWSFYEEGAGFAEFVRAAVEYLDGAEPPDEADSARLDRLLSHLQQRRVLLVLDGFERELRAYGRGDAVYRDEPDVRDERQRGCLDPQAETFLRGLGRPGLAGRVLMSTRLPPRCLDGSALVEPWRLEGLSQADALAYFAAGGIACTPAEAARIAADCGNHSLTLAVLAGWIKTRPDAGLGRVDWAGITARLTGFHDHHVLAVAVADLDDTARRVIAHLSVLRGVVSLTTAQALNEFLTPAELEAVLARLADRRLLARRRDGIDMHPLVRRWVYDHLLGPDGCRPVHAKASAYFQALPPPQRVERLADLEPLIELCRHTAAAGDLDAAWNIFYQRLRIDLLARFAGHGLARDLLLPLFPDGPEAPPRLSRGEARSIAIHDLGICASYGGDQRQARDFWRRSLEMDLAQKNRAAQADCREMLALGYWQLGELAAAEEQARQALDLTDPQNAFRVATRLQKLTECLITRGAAGDAAETLIRLAAVWPKVILPHPWTSEIPNYRARLALQRGDRAAAVAEGEAAMAEARAAGNEAELLEALILRARVGLDLDVTPDHADSAALAAAQEGLRRARDGGFVPYECEILPPWALGRWLEGARDEALAAAEEAAALSARCGYRLFEADARLALARMQAAAGRSGPAISHARAARQLARCGGPPDHTYWWVWTRSGQLLTALGAPPPDEA